MKKIIMLFTTLVTTIASFTNIKNLTNKTTITNDDQKFQLKLIINNETNDVNGKRMNAYIGWLKAYFYLDITIDGKVYNGNKNSGFNTADSNYHPFTPENGQLNSYWDVFWTNPNTLLNLITLNLDPDRTGVIINFTFKIYDGFHYQNTEANNYVYNFHKTYSDNQNNGTELIINSNGSWGSNTASWEFQYYKF